MTKMPSSFYTHASFDMHSPKEMVTPREMYAFLIEQVFEAFIQRRPDPLAALDAFAGDIHMEDETLSFTLPALFEFVCLALSLDSEQSNRDHYLAFRKTLYSQPTNTLLREKGGLVEIHRAHENHDLSVYKLIRLSS